MKSLENKEHVKSFESKEKNMPEMASCATDISIFSELCLFLKITRKAEYYVQTAGKQDKGKKRYFPPVTGNAASYSVGRIHWSYAYGNTRRGLFFVIVIVVAFQS